MRWRRAVLIMGGRSSIPRRNEPWFWMGWGGTCIRAANAGVFWIGIFRGCGMRCMWSLRAGPLNWRCRGRDCAGLPVGARCRRATGMCGASTVRGSSISTVRDESWSPAPVGPGIGTGITTRIFRRCLRMWSLVNRDSLRGGARRRTNLTIFDHLTSAGQFVGIASPCIVQALTRNFMNSGPGTQCLIVVSLRDAPVSMVMIFERPTWRTANGTPRMTASPTAHLSAALEQPSLMAERPHGRDGCPWAGQSRSAIVGGSPLREAAMVGAVHGILAGYDGSSGSDEALTWATREARARGAVLTVCHAWAPGYPAPPTEVAAFDLARRSGERI